MVNRKIRSILIILAVSFVIFILLYYMKDRMSINILPHLHMLFFKE